MPMPKPKGSCFSFFFFKKYRPKVMLDPINRIGPIEDAPNTDPMPPSNKKSPDPMPSVDLIILCN